MRDEIDAITKEKSDTFENDGDLIHADLLQRHDRQLHGNGASDWKAPAGDTQEIMHIRLPGAFEDEGFLAFCIVFPRCSYESDLMRGL